MRWGLGRYWQFLAVSTWSGLLQAGVELLRHNVLLLLLLLLLQLLPGVMTLDAWLLAQGLTLDALHLVQQHLPCQHQRRLLLLLAASSGVGRSGKPLAVTVVQAAAVVLRAVTACWPRAHMEQQLLDTFRRRGFCV